MTKKPILLRMFCDGTEVKAETRDWKGVNTMPNQALDIPFDLSFGSLNSGLERVNGALSDVCIWKKPVFKSGINNLPKPDMTIKAAE
jgi:hypothetical protein